MISESGLLFSTFVRHFDIFFDTKMSKYLSFDIISTLIFCKKIPITGIEPWYYVSILELLPTKLSRQVIKIILVLIAIIEFYTIVHTTVNTSIY